MIVGLEGINGAGKSTIAKAIADTTSFKYAKLPGFADIPTCVEIRKLLETKSKEMSPRTRFHLYTADMFEFFDKCETHNYILDRSWVSTVVYQSMDGIDEKHVYTTLQPIVSKIDYFVLLTCDTTVALDRMNNRTHQTIGSYANMNIEFYSNLQTEYRRVMKKYVAPMQQKTIDTTNKTIEQVVNEIKDLVSKYERTV